MDGRSSGEALRGSTASVVDKGLNLISQNSELLILISVGFVQIFAEVVGYKPFSRMNDLLPPLPNLGDKDVNEDNETDQNEVDLTNFTLIYQISKTVDAVGTYTAAMSLAAHVLLTYPVITGTQKMLLVPWLVVSLLRSVARELVVTILGIVLCASHRVFYYPCVRYSALQGAQFCFILYFWTSVHNFYHYLDHINSFQDLTNVINAINNASKDQELFFSPPVSVDVDEDDDITEATLVERAAMAWIAREILETDDEYVADNQFSQYLAIKATIELRQTLKELRERRKMRSLRKASTEEKEEEIHEFIKLSSLRKSLSREQAFDQSTSLSKRNTKRSIPYLTDGRSMGSLFTRITGMEARLPSLSMDAWSQTVPSTRRMRTLLDILENQQQRLRKDREDQSSI